MIRAVVVIVGVTWLATQIGVEPAYLLVPVGALCLVLAAKAKLGGGGNLAGGRYVQVRGHVHGRGSGLRRLIAKHEAGHAVAARALGGQVLSATVSPTGDAGLVQARFHENDPVKVIAFLKAGQYAVGTSSGAGADDAAIRAELRTVPREDRSRVRREAERTARRIVSSRSGEIRRDAARLNEKGAL